MIYFHYGSFRNREHFYLFYVAKHLRSEYPVLLSYNRFVELERKVMISFALFLTLICFDRGTSITFIDSTKIAVCKNKREIEYSRHRSGVNFLITLPDRLAAYHFFEKKPAIYHYISHIKSLYLSSILRMNQ
jgi:hypothetical protein